MVREARITLGSQKDLNPGGRIKPRKFNGFKIETVSWSEAVTMAMNDKVGE